MEINYYDIPHGGKIKFDRCGRNFICQIEWEADGVSYGVCASGIDEQQALERCVRKKESLK